VFSRKGNLRRHVRQSHQQQQPPPPPAPQPSTSKRKASHPPPSSPSLPPNKRSKNQPNKKQLLSYLPKDQKEIYEEHWNAIKTHKRPGKLQSTYTMMWSVKSDEPDWDSDLMSLFYEQNRRFKINYSHSFLLKDKESGQLSFFHASQNNNLATENPHLINSKSEFVEFLNELNDKDILQHVQKERPNSKSQVAKIMSTSFYVTPLSEFPIGGPTSELPLILKNSHHLYTLQKDKTNKLEYKDGLCLFRCLAIHKGANLRGLQKPSKQLFKAWSGHAVPPLHFPGVELFELQSIEDTFQVNIDVFDFDETHSTSTFCCFSPLRRSAGHHKETMRVLHYQQHFMYIKDIDKLAHAFSCSQCGQLWKQHHQLNRHEKKCPGKGPTESYRGGVYTPPKSIWQKLALYGLDVDENFVFPYRATFDFECFFDKDNIPQTKTDTTQFSAKHVPLSFAVCSNVPGFTEPQCFVTSGNSQELINQMVDYLEQISDTSYRLLKEQFQDVFIELNMIQKQEQEQEENFNSPINALKGNLEDYLRELPVVGFNSSKYDINLIKPFLIHRFVSHPSPQNKEQNPDGGDLDDDDDEEEEEDQAEFVKHQSDVKTTDKRTKRKSLGSEQIKFVIKRNNQFMCICTQKLKFLDIVNFLAPGFSYSKYLKAFQVVEQKGFFPYEYMTSLDRLNETSLPPHENFYSSLKQSNISKEDYDICQQVWRDRNMTTMKDFVLWYNCLDVEPFLKALQKQITLYKGLGVDLLKDGISVPGITLKYLFQTLTKSSTYFTLFDEKQKETHKLLRDNIVGGPSIIFHREHHKDKTYIRNNPQKPVQCIAGYDANALYLWALSQDMPTEYPIIKKKETGFQSETLNKYGHQAREWLEWVKHSNKLDTFKHKYNGREHALGQRRIRVDGWDPKNKVAYQFHGCLFHGHDCHLTRGHTVNPVNGKSLTELRQNTVDITRYLRETVGVTVVEHWECQWQEIKRQNQDIQHFLNTKCPVQKPFQGQSEQDILNAVCQNKLFGLIQCDIHVPQHLQEYFSEMQPIFKNADIGKEHIGPFMRQYADKFNLMNQPRRTLIGSFVGKEILLTTPLLKWYLQKGLVVTAVHQVIEYRPEACFREFADNVSDARRGGDADPSKTILAETFKLLGNSAYGKTLTNVAKHRDIYYVRCQDAQTLIKNKCFRKLTELTDDLVEIEMAKKRIQWHLPLQIGFFVYQYAKLRMLQFYYDCIDQYIDRSDFQLCEMDTDSLYMALSTPTLDEAVKPEMRWSFFQHFHQWFPAQACDEHQSQLQTAKLKDEAWVQPKCCAQKQKYDQRTPGLFKTEYTGDSFIGLCSKTYYCAGEYGDKYSSKGLSKHQNKLTINDFHKVLNTQESGGGTNIGFRPIHNSVYTYSQFRKSLSFLYIKRVVDSDGVSTKPILV